MEFLEKTENLQMFPSKREISRSNGRTGDNLSKRESPVQNGRVGMYVLPKIWNDYILQMRLPAIKTNPKVLTFAFPGDLVTKNLNF